MKHKEALTSFAVGRMEYFLESLNQASLKGRDTLAQDYPVPYEEALRDALVRAFDDTYMPALDYLIDSGLLDEIVLSSYNSTTGEFSPQLITSAFRNYFGPQWTSMIQTDIQDAAEEMWALGEDYIDSEAGVDVPSFMEGGTDEESVLSQLVLIGAIAGTLGAVDQIIYPSARRAAQQAFEGGHNLSELQALIQQALRVDAPGRARVYYDMLSTAMVNRARNIGRLHRSRMLGYTEVYWLTAGDEKVCPRCGALDGMSFSVEDLTGIVEDFVDASTTSEAISAMPWPNEADGDFVLPDGSSVSMTSAAEILAAHGIGIPPLHPHCRCDLEVVKHSG